MNPWQTFVISILGSSAMAGTLIFILREWISSRIRNSIQHEYEISRLGFEAKLNGELEGTKAAYQKFIDENNIRFSRLHKDQADVIRLLYAKIVVMEQKVGALVSPLKMLPIDEEEKKAFLKTKADGAWKAFYECYTYYQQVRIYFTPGVCETLDHIFGVAKASYVRYVIHDEEELLDDHKESRRERFNAYEDMDKDFSKMKLVLEEEFRRIIGLSEKSKGIE